MLSTNDLTRHTLNTSHPSKHLHVCFNIIDKVGLVPFEKVKKKKKKKWTAEEKHTTP